MGAKNKDSRQSIEDRTIYRGVVDSKTENLVGYEIPKNVDLVIPIEYSNNTLFVADPTQQTTVQDSLRYSEGDIYRKNGFIGKEWVEKDMLVAVVDNGIFQMFYSVEDMDRWKLELEEKPIGDVLEEFSSFKERFLSKGLGREKVIEEVVYGYPRGLGGKILDKVSLFFGRVYLRYLNRRYGLGLEDGSVELSRKKQYIDISSSKLVLDGVRSCKIKVDTKTNDVLSQIKHRAIHSSTYINRGYYGYGSRFIELAEKLDLDISNVYKNTRYSEVLEDINFDELKDMDDFDRFLVCNNCGSFLRGRYSDGRFIDLEKCDVCDGKDLDVLDGFPAKTHPLWQQK